MKKIFAALIFSLTVGTPCFAQDAPPTGIGYIPGMPVPQAAPAAPAPQASGSTASRSGSADGGKIAKVSVRSKDSRNVEVVRPNAQDAAAAVPAAPAEKADVQTDQAEYRGVTPPVRMSPENQNTFSKTDANQLSWIGFLPEETSHRVFMQTSRPTTFERLATAGDRVELLITNTKLVVSNNQRELDMQYFKSPFSRAYAKSEGKNVHVYIELKEAVPVEVKQQDNLINVTASLASKK